MNIYLLRHGATKGNLQRRYLGRTDEPLCEQGRVLAQKLAGKLTSSSVAKVYSSPLLRCRQTARLVFPEKKIQIIDGFRECEFGEFEYRTYEELSGNTAYQRWIDSGGIIGFPGGEDRQTFCARSVGAFYEAVEDMKKLKIHTAAMVIHGGTIMAILSTLAQPPKDYYYWQVKNCEGYLIQWQSLPIGFSGECHVLEKIGEKG